MSASLWLLIIEALATRLLLKSSIEDVYPDCSLRLYGSAGVASSSICPKISYRQYSLLMHRLKAAIALRGEYLVWG
ncbi:hypothetical protein [Microcystis aeruginosa]|uniref:Uncharacterized protein n=1 Tax=Microcystis aeruginosa (strain NIES-843 / IAM M-2473) TaxID=449447 RepID=B0JSV3_MICAN|nr:hypothetical protein [Microcystis aeruginosa]BAG00997.1 unknown protein [Microcystis aeruginosa NIES-843]